MQDELRQASDLDQREHPPDERVRGKVDGAGATLDRDMMSMASPVLHEFLVVNRDEILDRSRTKLIGRDVSTPTESELADGLPLFLDQLVAVLRSNDGEQGAGYRSVAESASLHGGTLLRMGLTVGQVVQDYGSICQSVTEVAGEHQIAITAYEFQTLNHCLDEAIAKAVTEYEHQRDLTFATPAGTHLGVLAHEMRNLLSASMLAFGALSRGIVGVHGSTGALLGRSLRSMRVLIDRTLAEARLEANVQTPERVLIATLIEEIEIIAMVEAKDRDVRLSVHAGPHDAAVVADHQILASVVANLVQNAFKFTRRGGHVTIRGRSAGDRVLIEVQDECGGLPPGQAEELFLPFARRGADQSGLGLGLTISLKGIRASGGEIYIRDLPGSGCLFTIDLPIAPRELSDSLPRDDASPRAPLPPESSEASGAVFLRPSVLIADDDEESLAALRKLLSGLYRLTFVRDGAEGLTALKRQSFDLAIVDLGLPMIDGLRMVETIRGADDGYAPAFLFISGQSNPEMKARALSLGAVDFMTKPFDPDELMARMARILTSVTREASLLADAMTDSLTGLANYRSFAQTLDREFERSRRYDLPLSVISVDLDHLKVINDQHGHDAGNDAIRLVAKVLTGAVRKFELVARPGGDEFAVILPNTNALDARQLADRLREAVGAQTVFGIKLSASLGLASWNNRDRDVHVDATALLKASDEALYRAKRGGRGRVEGNEV